MYNYGDQSDQSCLHEEEVLGLAYSNLATETKITVGLLAGTYTGGNCVISSLDQDKKRLLKRTTLPNRDRAPRRKVAELPISP